MSERVLKLIMWTCAALGVACWVVYLTLAATGAGGQCQ